jgi:hypothetical protein
LFTFMLTTVWAVCIGWNERPDPDPFGSISTILNPGFVAGAAFSGRVAAFTAPSPAAVLGGCVSAAAAAAAAAEFTTSSSSSSSPLERRDARVSS